MLFLPAAAILLAKNARSQEEWEILELMRMAGEELLKEKEKKEEKEEEESEEKVRKFQRTYDEWKESIEKEAEMKRIEERNWREEKSNLVSSH